jgi:hypothetical protein
MADVDFNEVISRSQATTIDGMGKMFAMSSDLQRGIATNKWDEVDLLQAAAAKELGKAGENPRYQPQTAPAAA